MPQSVPQIKTILYIASFQEHLGWKILKKNFLRTIFYDVDLEEVWGIKNYTVSNSFIGSKNWPLV